MKKNLQYFLMALVLMTGASFVFSCAKSELPEAEKLAPQGGFVTIGATLPEVGSPAGDEGSKVAFAPVTAGGMNLLWESGDQLYVSSGASSSVFTLSEGAGSASARFGGNALSGNAFDIIYPGSLAGMEAASTYSYEGQVQQGNGSTAHLQYIAALSGVNAYEDFAFSQTWATAAGGSFKQNGCLKLRLKLPASVTSVSGVSVAAPSAIFYSTNAASSAVKRVSLSLSNVDVSESGQILTAYMMLSWQGAVVPADASLVVTVGYGDGQSLKKSVPFASSYTFDGGYEHLIQLNDSGWTDGPAFEGDGSQEDPYIIRTPLQLVSVNPLLVTGQTVYFSLANDIDMTGVTWVPFNNVWGNKPFYLEGNGHTVSNVNSAVTGSYNGFFGHLLGTVKNLNIDHITSTIGDNYPGAALAGWIGTDPASYDRPALVENVHLTNASVVNGFTRKVGTAGFAARSGNATIRNCSFSGSLSNTMDKGSLEATDSPTGGIVAYDYGNNTYENVSFTGSISVTPAFNNIGGIVGYCAAATTLTGCQANITNIAVASSSNVGGIVGFAADALTVTGTTSPRSVVSFPTFNAVSFVGGVVGRTDKAPTISNYSVTLPVTLTATSVSRSAGILAYSADGCTISNCDADVTLAGHSSLAGIVAYGTTTSRVSGCSTSGTITPNNTYAYPCVAGIMGGSTGTTTISGCQSSMSFNSQGSSTAGIYGQTGDGVVLTISDCSYNGTITTTTKTSMYAAGILAYARNPKTVTISRCSSAGTIKTCARSGGIMGYSNNSTQSNASITIENCWSSAYVEVKSFDSTGGGYAGGIAGDIQKNVTVRNCYFTGTVKGNFASGGIVGRASNATNTVAATTATGGYNDTVSGCICWAELITCQDGYKRSTEKGYSDGAIVGFTNIYNTLSNSWRKNGLNFLWYSSTHGGSEWNPTFNALADQEDADASTPLTGFPQGQTAPNQSPYQYDYGYNGKASGASETLSAVAQRIGWSASVWDFSGETPVLR